MTTWNTNEDVHLGRGDFEGVEGDIPAELFTEHGLPDVGVDTFVVVRSRVWHLVRRKRVMFGVVLEGELSRTCEHRPLRFLGDFAIEGVYLGKKGRLRWLPINWGFGRGL